jgi:hypothetical protein
VDGVDYVLADYVRDTPTRNKLNFPSKAIVDLWPEEVVIYDPDPTKGVNRYIRADVLFMKGNVLEDYRLTPKSEDGVPPNVE